MDKFTRKNLTVCLITGPAGAGKSSVSKALAEKFERSAVIDVDHLRSMVVGGNVRPWPYNEEAEIQTVLSARNACILADNFLDQGFNVIINDVIGSRLHKQYLDYFKQNNFKVFLLLPSMKTLLERFDERGKDDNLRARTEELHDKFTLLKDELDWKIVDSNNHTLEQTTDQVFKELIK